MVVQTFRPVPLPLLAVALLVGLGVLLPLVYLGLRAAQAEPQQLAEIVLRPRNLQLLGNTLALLLGVIALTTLLALPLAWLTSRTDLRGRRLWTLLLTLPLAVPGYVGVFGFFGATGGSGWLSGLLGFTWPRPTGYLGALGVLTLFTYPYLFLNLRAALLGLDSALEESARSLGYRGLQVFFRVVLPQLRPALYAGWLLVGLHVLGDFGVVSLVRFETFSYAIYLQYSSAFDRVYAAWLSLMLLLLTGSLLWLEARLLKNLAFSRVGLGSSRLPRRTPLGYWALPAYAFLLLPVVGALVVPLVSIGYWVVQYPADHLNGWEGVVQALRNSAQASAPAALLSALMALPLAYLGVRYPSRLTRALERVAYLGYATPPLAFALALIFFSLRGAPFLYQTLALLVLAYALHFLAEAIGPVRSALYQAPPRLEEAARSLGFSPLGAFFRATFPLLRRGMLASMALVFLSAMKELPLTFLLAPVGYSTLATRIWGYTSEALFAEAAPYALLVVLLSAGFVGLLLTQER
ncbi:MAG: iron ABC transporter permease [Meiothermus sp.]|uniref:ABC transporter permease n=1 Tax=Meiothermus sp. TaxID=1955249 RepID=UPI0025F30746|nr:iron ABC transporter permease [Meiothermus sp.]MCS7058037.1 iron ABC transporter permease [Meiothermus sp.]MCS7194540.1 iron ABC transporter permease [Meiothermus sp.]MCX7741364.1 iron ABC transporter permease [Meiothermus sp.]MDW8091728.1 iron ABC transporter permease [Meiothermus sp.]MDW8480585.1 iron ABC transporter permease [Meiothermus sp.]